MIERAEHSKIALGENEDTCYTVENDEFSEKNQYEEYPVYLPRQYTNRARKPLIFLDFLKLTEKIYYLFTTY